MFSPHEDVDRSAGSNGAADGDASSRTERVIPRRPDAGNGIRPLLSKVDDLKQRLAYELPECEGVP